MKRPSILFLILCCVFCTAAFAQQPGQPQPCNNPDILRQADSLKQIYTKDGFTVVREASIAMESEYEMPVVVPLQDHSIYQFVFIGDMTSKLYEVRVYDQSEKMVIYQKKQWGDIDGNIIEFAYVPKFSEWHMFKPVQVNKKKKKDLCGYVMLLKKTKA